MTQGEGASRGASHRKAVRRGDLARWDPKLRRQDPSALLAKSVHGRVQAVLPIKTERMRASPFGYFRGAAPVMAYDLSLGAHTAIENQICGDAHVENLGAYTGVDGRLIFDINDFDETIRGPFEWDVKRMTTSLLLAGAQAGIRESGCEGAAEAFLTAYCARMADFAKMPVLAVARFQVHRLGENAAISGILARAERSTPLHSQEHLTVERGRSRVFRSAPPLLRRVRGAERSAVLEALGRYGKTLAPERQHFFRQFRALDVAFKVVGTGSVGMRDFCVYMEGNGPEDPMFLQVKEEVASAYAPYLPKTAAREGNEGERVVNGQRAMQLESDPMLGWTRMGGRDYVVRQLNDHKAALDVTTLDEAGLGEYAQVCGELLARGHARSGEASLIAGYVGGGKRFRSAMMAFGTAYAAQTTADWKALVAQVKTKG